MMVISTMAEHAITELPAYLKRVEFDEPNKVATLNFSVGSFLTIDSASAARQLADWVAAVQLLFGPVPA